MSLPLSLCFSGINKILKKKKKEGLGGGWNGLMGAWAGREVKTDWSPQPGQPRGSVYLGSEMKEKRGWGPLEAERSRDQDP